MHTGHQHQVLITYWTEQFPVTCLWAQTMTLNRTIVCVCVCACMRALLTKGHCNMRDWEKSRSGFKTQKVFVLLFYQLQWITLLILLFIHICILNYLKTTTTTLSWVKKAEWISGFCLSSTHLWSDEYFTDSVLTISSECLNDNWTTEAKCITIIVKHNQYTDVMPAEPNRVKERL